MTTSRNLTELIAETEALIRFAAKGMNYCAQLERMGVSREALAAVAQDLHDIAARKFPTAANSDRDNPAPSSTI